LVYSKRQYSDGTIIGIWKIEETVEQMLCRYPHLRKYGVEQLFRNDGRRLEYLCVRALLAELTNDATLAIDYEESGKPVMPDRFVSISHTKGYAALILSQAGPVAVDIEKISEIGDVVAERFIRPDEQAPDNSRRLVIWSAKESLYKYFSEERLGYFDMYIHANENALAAENLKSHKRVEVMCELTPDFVLTFILPQS